MNLIHFLIPIIASSSVAGVTTSKYLQVYPPPRSGSVDLSVTRNTICNPRGIQATSSPSYLSKLKSDQIKKMRYPDSNPANYEEDYIIPIELGGSLNDPNNLWAQSYTSTLKGQVLGVNEKNKAEIYLHDQVCSGNMSLKEAQKMISTDWVSVYKNMMEKHEQ